MNGTTIRITVNIIMIVVLRLSAVVIVEYTPWAQRPKIQIGNMYLMTVFQVFPTLIEELLFNVSIKSSNLYTQPKIIHSRSIANSNAKLFKYASNTPKIVLPAPVANMVDIKNPTIQTTVAVFLRSIRNFSEIE